jgi:ribosomal-protein-alanine N-acetyltransferase
MIKEFPVIKTNRLLLRQFVDSDLANVFKGLSHPDIIKYYGVSYDSLEAAKKQMIFFADLERNETGTWWAICSTDNKIFYGAAGLNNLSKTHKKAEIGFWLLCEHLNKGIMTEAIPTVCDYGFDKLGLHRIEAFVETPNENSKKLLLKFNFQHEGTMRDCEIKNGNFISLHIYAKINANQVISQTTVFST